MAQDRNVPERKTSTIRAVDQGRLTIADQVLSLLACKATMEIDGVVSMAGGIIDDLAALVRRGETPKGVRILKSEEQIAVEISVEVEYGKDMTKIGSDIQVAVAKAVKQMAGIDLAAVNVNIAGVHIAKIPDKRTKQTSETGL